MQFSCPFCGESASMAYVNELTCTICGACNNIHIAEIDMYIQMELSNLVYNAAPIKRNFLLMAYGMQAIYENWDLVYASMSAGA